MSDFELIRRRLDEQLAPPHNLTIETARIRQAAVTLLLREAQSEAELLIIKRAEREGDPWSGHLALPGGRAEPQDENLLATAARETHEEIGVDLHNGGMFIGQLPLIAPRIPRLPQIEITPLVAIAPPKHEFQFSDEVVSAFWVSVGRLKREGRSGEHRWQFGGTTQKWPAYPTEQGLIWGITERILTNFLELLD
ncbi:MAG TPA: CoA pyrophosphatase [Blastocatellia bacterium]|nr:CoA pyrophosphatase [Blastocatellia bacterium]